jgi:hypothetical protein
MDNRTRYALRNCANYEDAYLKSLILDWLRDQDRYWRNESTSVLRSPSYPAIHEFALQEGWIIDAE